MDDNNDTTNACFDNSGFNSANSLTHLLDEDPNEFPCITLSEYIDVETFGKQLSQVKSKLSILSLNIQTINAKFDEFKIILDNKNQPHPISVICLQETHLDENDPTLSFELNDYQLISKSRYCSKAGGLIIYIHNDFNFKHVDISSEMSDNDETKPSWESLFIEIKHRSTNFKTHIIGNIYRRPIDIVSSCNNFSAAFAKTLTLLQKKKRSIYIAGDFNIDLLKVNENSIIVL